MSEESHLLEPKLTFAEFGIQFMIAKSLQNYAKMFLMFVLAFGVNEDVINEYHHKFIQEVHKYLVHHMHKECRSVGEAEGHDSVFVKTVPSGERGLRNISLLNLELMISHPQINL